MSADSTPDPYSTVPPSTDPPSSEAPPLPPEMGYSEIGCDILPAYDLTDVQFRAIELTVQGLGDVQIAQMLAINRRTLWHWKSFNDEYRRALTDARIQVHSAVSDRYRTLLLRATSVMAKFLEDPSENNRFRASYALLMMAGCFKPIPLLAAAQSESFNWPPPELPPKVG
ncbi:MAG: hypothetical protein ABSB74_17640 [Tepidisphaeraceae bacterium]